MDLVGDGPSRLEGVRPKSCVSVGIAFAVEVIDEILSGVTSPWVSPLDALVAKRPPEAMEVVCDALTYCFIVSSVGRKMSFFTSLGSSPSAIHFSFCEQERFSDTITWHKSGPAPGWALFVSGISIQGVFSKAIRYLDLK